MADDNELGEAFADLFRDDSGGGPENPLGEPAVPLVDGTRQVAPTDGLPVDSVFASADETPVRARRAVESPAPGSPAAVNARRGFEEGAPLSSPIEPITQTSTSSAQMVAPFSTQAAPDLDSAPPGGVTPAHASSADLNEYSEPSGRSFGRTLGWTVLGGIIPGLGLLKSGRKAFGGISLGIFVVLLLGAGSLAFVKRTVLMSWVLDPTVLTVVAAVATVVALLWIVVIGFSHLTLRPNNPSIGQRAAGAIVVALLSFVIAAPLAFAANISLILASTIDNVFKTEDEGGVTVPEIPKENPWANIPRVNFLVLGGDSGTGRSSTMDNARMDAVMVVSVDTATGDTTLISLPRNMTRTPFPKDSPLHKYFPNGFTDGNPGNPEYFLNALWRNVPDMVPKNILGNPKTLHSDALKLAVGEAVGLDISYYVFVNLDGFKDMINALGGITLNVNYRIGRGGNTDKNIPPKSYIEPGPNKHLMGRDAMWYARGRWKIALSDYARMERQRCVINAVVQQASPENVLLRFQSIAAAGDKTIDTDIPRQVLANMVDLATKVQGTKLRSVVFINGKNGYSFSNPDFKLMRSQVKQALSETKDTNTPTEQPSTLPSAGSTIPSASSSASSSPSPSASKSSKPRSDDLDDACAYHPVEPPK